MNKKRESARKAGDDIESRLKNIMEAIISIASVDFSNKAAVSKRGDMLDAIATGLNMLGEELEANILDRKRAEEALAKSLSMSRATLESTADGILVVDMEGKTTGFNERFKKMWRLPDHIAATEDDTKMIDFVFNQLEDPAKFAAKIRELYKKPEESSLDTLRFRDGRVFERYSQPQKIDDRTVGRVWSFRDISGRKRTEEELREARDKAEEATREKDKYISLIAHDLKTPFASMISFLQILKREDSPMSADVRDELLDKIRESAERSVELIDDVLRTSRFAEGRFEPKRRFFDGRQVAGFTVSHFEHLARDKGIEIVNDAPDGLRLFGDERLFGEVLHNLLSNAIKFTGHGGRVTIRTPTDHPSAIIVEDTGEGIDETALPLLFRRDVKTSTAGTRGETGAGMALPICAEIMKALGGEITVQSTKGKGSAFCASLPCVHPVVLMADDDKVVRFTMKRHLEALGAGMLEVTGGAAALETIRQERPHLVLLDLYLPDMSGFDVLERVRADPATAGIPVIVMTSDSRMEVMEKAIKLGADDFIAKPARAEDLVPRVRNFIV